MVAELFSCDVCHKTHNSYQRALDCEFTEPNLLNVKVGDIVTAQFGFGWYNGDKRWLVNPELELTGSILVGDMSVPVRKKGKCPNHSLSWNCFDRCCTWGFYYVVTDMRLRKNSHLMIYSVRTGAMEEPNGHIGGWTGSNHVRLTAVTDPPPFVVEDSKRLIGWQAPEGRLL